MGTYLPIRSANINSQMFKVTQISQHCFGFPKQCLSLRKSFSTNSSSDKSIQLRRVLFNVPGSDQKKILKATQLNLDTVVLDLEDGVAINQKKNAREIVVKMVKNEKFGRAEKCTKS